MTNTWNTKIPKWMPDIPQYLAEVFAERHKKRNVQDFWLFVCNAQPSAIAWYQRTAAPNLIHTKVKKSLQEMERFYKHNKSAPGKGKGKGKGKPAGGKAQGKGKNNPHVHVDDLFYPHLEAFTHASSGMVADNFPFSEVHQGTTGICIATIKDALPFMLAMEAQALEHEFAFVIMGNQLDVVDCDDKEVIINAYRMTDIMVPCAPTKADIPVERKAVMINMGPSDITYEAQFTEIIKPPTQYTNMSVRICKAELDDKVYNATAAQPAFAAHIHATFKKEWLTTTQKPAPTFIKIHKYLGEDTPFQYGWIHVLNDKVQDVMKRSGHNGVTVYTQGRDSTTKVISLRKCTSMKEALITAQKAKEPARGIVINNLGQLMLRIFGDDAALGQAKALLDPALAEELGDLLTMTEDKGTKYVIKGMDTTWNFLDIVKLLKNAMKWRVRPEKFIKSTYKSSNNVIVFAVDKPPKMHFKYAGTNTWATIVDYVPNKVRITEWHRVYQEYFRQHPYDAAKYNNDDEMASDDEAEDEHGSSDAYYGMGMQHTPAEPRTAWCDVQDDHTTGWTDVQNAWNQHNNAHLAQAPILHLRLRNIPSTPKAQTPQTQAPQPVLQTPQAPHLQSPQQAPQALRSQAGGAKAAGSAPNANAASSGAQAACTETKTQPASAWNRAKKQSHEEELLRVMFAPLPNATPVDAATAAAATAAADTEKNLQQQIQHVQQQNDTKNDLMKQNIIQSLTTRDTDHIAKQKENDAKLNELHQNQQKIQQANEAANNKIQQNLIESLSTRDTDIITKQKENDDKLMELMQRMQANELESKKTKDLMQQQMQQMKTTFENTIGHLQKQIGELSAMVTTLVTNAEEDKQDKLKTSKLMASMVKQMKAIAKTTSSSAIATCERPPRSSKRPKGDKSDSKSQSRSRSRNTEE